MYRAAQKNSQRTRRHSLGANHADMVVPDCPSTPDSGNQNSVRGKNRVNRRRSSNNSISSLFFREEGRAVKTGVIVIMSFLCLWLPYFAYKVFESAFCYQPYLEDVAILIAMSSSCITPFIYVYRNDMAQEEALKVICWWRPKPQPTQSTPRPPSHNKFPNGHSKLPVRIVEPETGSLYSYSEKCRECGENQLVSALKHYRPMGTPNQSQDRRRSSCSPRRESSVSFKLGPVDRPTSRCRQCIRQDSASSASSEDPLLMECYRHPRHSTTSVRWTRQRLSNGSVTTRSDSLASTNSSVLSYGFPRWSARRFSTVSTDSGGTVTRRCTLEEAEDLPLDPSIPRPHSAGQRFDVDIETHESTELPEFHGHSNPFRHPRLYRRQESVCSSSRFIWEIEEGDIRDEENPDEDFSDSPHLETIQQEDLSDSSCSQDKANIKRTSSKKRSSSLSPSACLNIKNNSVGTSDTKDTFTTLGSKHKRNSLSSRHFENHKKFSIDSLSSNKSAVAPLPLKSGSPIDELEGSRNQLSLSSCSSGDLTMKNDSESDSSSRGNSLSENVIKIKTAGDMTIRVNPLKIHKGPIITLSTSSSNLPTIISGPPLADTNDLEFQLSNSSISDNECSNEVTNV